MARAATKAAQAIRQRDRRGLELHQVTVPKHGSCLCHIHSTLRVR